MPRPPKQAAGRRASQGSDGGLIGPRGGGLRGKGERVRTPEGSVRRAGLAPDLRGREFGHGAWVRGSVYGRQTLGQ